MNSRSDTAGQGRRPNFNFPTSRLSEALRDVGNDYVLIDRSTGQIWTNGPDAKFVHQMLDEATKQVQPEGVG